MGFVRVSDDRASREAQRFWFTVLDLDGDGACVKGAQTRARSRATSQRVRLELLLRSFTLRSWLLDLHRLPQGAQACCSLAPHSPCRPHWG